LDDFVLEYVLLHTTIVTHAVAQNGRHSQKLYFTQSYQLLALLKHLGF